eukprot:2172863-Heterocapsa_arctica.AAC.1
MTMNTLDSICKSPETWYTTETAWMGPALSLNTPKGKKGSVTSKKETKSSPTMVGRPPSYVCFKQVGLG